MLAMEEGTHVSAYVEDTLLAWMQLYPAQPPLTDLSQVCDGRFLLSLLETLPHFKLVSPLSELGEEAGLASRVATMKTITKSLIHYHQQHLLRDVSEFAINYVELCMGNRKELFRLITILFSALCSQNASRVALEEQISRLSEDKYEVIKIMIDNSMNLGQECGSCSSRSWRLSQQKKVFAKMELLENKIEQLQIVNCGLQQAIKVQKESEELLIQENKKIKEQIKRLLTLNDELVDSNEKALNQIKILTIEETGSAKKLEIVRVKMQQKIDTLQLQIAQLQRECQQGKGLKEEMEIIKGINKQIKEQIEDLRGKLVKSQQEKCELKRLQRIHSQKFIALKEHCSELEVKIQELELACSSNSNSAEGNTKTCYFGGKSDDDDINFYRVKDNLGWLNSENLQNVGSFAKFQIKTITQRSFEDSICLEHMKENQSILINNSEIINMNQSFSKPASHQIEAHLQSTERSLEFRKLQRQFMEEIKVLTCVILDLQTQLEEANKRNPVVYNENDEVSRSRMQRFKCKVKEIFNKGNGLVK